eukprot:953869-Heterocapsa_arctica.AAC.1
MAHHATSLNINAKSCNIHTTSYNSLNINGNHVTSMNTPCNIHASTLIMQHPCKSMPRRGCHAVA